MTTPEYRLNQLKLNAPLLYPSYVAKRKSYITNRLDELRIKYKNETEEGKKRVLNEVEKLQEEQKLYEGQCWCPYTNGEIKKSRPYEKEEIPCKPSQTPKKEDIEQF